jgi:hypothetical protein
VCSKQKLTSLGKISKNRTTKQQRVLLWFQDDVRWMAIRLDGPSITSLWESFFNIDSLAQWLKSRIIRILLFPGSVKNHPKLLTSPVAYCSDWNGITKFVVVEQERSEVGGIAQCCSTIPICFHAFDRTNWKETLIRSAPIDTRWRGLERWVYLVARW